jgi:uncharacterized protein YcfL
VRKILVLFVFFLLFSGCVDSTSLPSPSDFKTTVITPNKTLKIGEEFVVDVNLKNLSKSKIKITHGAPLAHVYVYDAEGKEVTGMKITATVGIPKTLKSGEIYYAGDGEGRKITLDKLGTYKVEALANFVVNDKNGERHEYNVKSEPVFIEVKGEEESLD